MGRFKMRILLILNILGFCSTLSTSPYLGTVGLTSWDRSETPVLEYRKRSGNDFTSWDRSIFGKRFAKRGPGLALFGGTDNMLKDKADKMCQRSSAIIALIACNQYCDSNPECQLPSIQGNEDTKDELMKMTRVKYCSDNYDQEHSFCMDQMGY